MQSTRFLLLATTALTALLSALACRATPIYTWEDEHGVVHFSDQPRPGASTVELDIPATVSPLPAATPPPAPDDTTDNTESDAPLPPATIRMLSPLHQQTIRDNEGNIKVAAATNRELNQGVTVRLLLDGAPYALPQSRPHWRLSNIDRGSHTLQAQMLKDGKVIASTEVITVYLHRASQLKRQPPAVIPK